MSDQHKSTRTGEVSQSLANSLLGRAVVKSGSAVCGRDVRIHGTFVPENFSGTFVLRERKFQGTKVSPMELSFPGTKVLGYESSSYRSADLGILGLLLQDSVHVHSHCQQE